MDDKVERVFPTQKVREWKVMLVRHTLCPRKRINDKIILRVIEKMCEVWTKIR